MSRILKIAALQKRMGSAIQPAEFDRLRELDVDLVCLPEYFFIPDKVRNQTITVTHRNSILEKLAIFSKHLRGIIIGGSLIEQEGSHYYNACHVFDNGDHIGSYRKVHPTLREREIGISPGDGYKVLEVRGIKLAPLICADVLFLECFEALAELKPDLIVIPTTSPFQPDDSTAEKSRRDQEIFVAGAYTANAYILKTCGVGLLMGKRLQGRSLICSPNGIITRIDPGNEALEKTLIAELDLDELRSSENIKDDEDVVEP